MRAYVVVIRTNLDDIVAGVYGQLKLARERLRELLANPEKCRDENAMGLPDRAGLISVAILKGNNDLVEFKEQECFPEPPEVNEPAPASRNER